MATYFMNEGAFELPDAGLVDRTVHVFDAPLPGGEELGLLVCRTRFPPGKSLRDMVTAHVTHEAKRLSGYSILDEREAEWAGVPALEVRSRWRHAGKVVYQRQAHLAAAHTWLLFAVSAPLAERELGDRHMEQILSTLRLRDGE